MPEAPLPLIYASQKCLQTFPNILWEEKSPSVENHWSSPRKIQEVWLSELPPSALLSPRGLPMVAGLLLQGQKCHGGCRTQEPAAQTLNHYGYLKGLRMNESFWIPEHLQREINSFKRV